MRCKLNVLTAALATLVGLSGTVCAQERGEHREGPAPHAQPRAEPRGEPRGAPRVAPHLQLDSRYHHDHYYPPHGYAVPALPSGSVSIGFGGGSYFFHGGVWFRPYGGRFIVSLPPIGIVIPLLPPDYATLWIGGAPYYYANGVYYTQSPGQGYVVVAPPPGADAAQPVPAPAPPRAQPDPIYYPRTGQSAAQTETDRQECNRWATTQPRAMADAQVFQRAVAACMDGRGYTVR